MPDPKFFYYLSLASIGFLALVSPILASLAVVLFRGKGVRGRWLFLVVAPVVAYTILWVFTLVFIVPATFVVVLLAPGTKDLFDQMPYWFGVASWVTQHQYLIAAVSCGALSAWLALWLWPRWPNILFALAQPPGTKITIDSGAHKGEA